MPGDRQTRLFTIPVDRAFADALAGGLIDRFGNDPIALSGGMILLPSNRARAAVQAAFVRLAGHGLLLPRLVALGDSELEESAGFALDDDLLADPLPPAIDPLRRRLILSRLIIANWEAMKLPLLAPASLRLADALGRVIDQLHFEELGLDALDAVADEQLSAHWQVSKRHLQLLLDDWPAELARTGSIDLADRRNRMLDRLASRWRQGASLPFIVAAGISVTAPAVARLLRVIADLPQGMVVLPGLDVSMSAAEWDALGPARSLLTGPRPLDGHPQFQFKLLLDRMGVARDEVQDWPAASDQPTKAARARLASAMFMPAPFTADWREQIPTGASAGIRVAEFADDAAEAQGIALLLREALEIPGRTAALVTPDRQLAQRVTSALSRWGIAADDSAGEALASSPPGSLARLALEAATSDGLVPLIALLSHPLARPAGDRGGWLARVRELDLRLRGPGRPATLDGIAAYLRTPPEHRKDDEAAKAQREALAAWWDDAATLLAPLWAAARDDVPLAPLQLLDALTQILDRLSAGAAWQGVAGRQLATLIDRWRDAAADGPRQLPASTLARQFDDLLAGEIVRQPFGRHPRIFIWGLLEARLQRADLMILGGLNEGGWPAETSPDPWLAPGIRRKLGLPSLERAQGLAAHDFVTALGAPDVVVTRAQRQGSDPAVASRLWLRLQALAGPLPEAAIGGQPVTRIVAAIDRPDHPPKPAAMPSVAPGKRPDRVNLTALDVLAQDPYAFYARHILGLRPLDQLDMAPDARWRGNRVHRLIELWAKAGADPVALDAAIADLARDPALDPVEAAGWLPRIEPALRWVAAALAEAQVQGRVPVAHEIKGEWTVEGITVTTKADRIDQTAEGLVVVDYKTGKPPGQGKLKAGQAMQLGLLAAMIEAHAFSNLPDLAPAGAEYWVLTRDSASGDFGKCDVPYASRRTVKSFEELIDLACEAFAEMRAIYLLGNAPFLPGEGKSDYDQLARRDEWVGRPRAGDAA